MKHGEAARSNYGGADYDLDDLERQLASVSAPRRAGDDPLAELARIVGQDERGRAAPRAPAAPASFDDFLKAPPRAANGAMPRHTPPIEPLFPPREVRPAQERDPLAEALGEGEIGLRGTLPIAAVPPPPPVRWEPARSEPAPAANIAPAGRFDDMLAEFEAAMRDAGGAPTAPALPPEEPPAAFVPPMADRSAEARPRLGRGILLAGGVMGVALIGVVSLLAFGGQRAGSGSAAPVIAAKPGVTKERPANPGGVEVPNQDKEVLQTRAAGAAPAERMAPREEQPVDLGQAQRNAEAQAPAVRQIPGVLVVNPSGAGATAAGQPPQTPARPVASVPIVISGQAPAPPTAPVVAPPVLTPPAPVAVAAPLAAPTAPASLPALQPAAPQASVAAPTPAAAAQAAANAEPRRVRAVPIRPDDGAPNRAQAQPRVVPAAPRPAQTAAAPAAEDPNAPLSITPQATNRAPPLRVPTIAPGAVPASTGTAPITTQSTTASTSSGGFAVQIAAEGSEDAAQAKFNRMRAQYGGVLGSVSPSIRGAEVNGRSVYRVRVGDLSREEATGLCERLKAQGGSCFVARN